MFTNKPDSPGWYWMIGFGPLRIIEIEYLEGELWVSFHGTGDGVRVSSITPASAVTFSPIAAPNAIREMAKERAGRPSFTRHDDPAGMLVRRR